MEEQKKYPLNMIYFYLTEGCNLRCRHCWLAPKHQSKNHVFHSLPLEYLSTILKQAKPLGLTGVKLTGGEPLMHPEILQVIQTIQKMNLKLSIETNGTLCTPEIAQAISHSKKPFVSVSLDGAKKSTHEKVRGVKDSFDAALRGIQYLTEVGIKPQIIFTLMRMNHEEMEAVVHLAESLKAASIKFNVLQPTARGETLHQKQENLTITELFKLNAWVDNTLSKTTQLPIYFDLPLAFRPLGKVFNPEAPCGVCGILGILGVLHNGSYALCGIGEHIKELVFGHVDTDPLEKVWSENKVLNNLRQGLPKNLEGVCQKCLLKSFCKGGCLAQNYYSTKSLWGNYWLCEEAFKNGLFPATRLR